MSSFRAFHFGLIYTVLRPSADCAGTQFWTHIGAQSSRIRCTGECIGDRRRAQSSVNVEDGTRKKSAVSVNCL